MILMDRSARLTHAACLGLLLLLLLLSGCARYHPLALPTAPDLTSAPALTAPSNQFWTGSLKPHAFPAHGFDETAVVTLAVFDNPDLKAARLQEGVAEAQLLQAGLLPDPQLTAGYAYSALNYGYDAGLSEDLQALITRGAARAGARAHVQQVHLDILWQEWQVAERARELFIEARAQEQLRQVLTETRDLLARQYSRDTAALNQGNLTLSTTSADLDLLTNAQTSLHLLETKANLTRHALNRLLGLKPDVRLVLVGPNISKPLSSERFHAAIAALPHRRADLLALQAGYRSQEENVRRAILEQFPPLSVGVVKARDPAEGINSFGVNTGLTLPLFNRNRGQIAIERATRAVLRATYQARLDQATGDADQAWNAASILRRQLAEVQSRLPLMQRNSQAAEQSFRKRNLDAALYVSLKSSLLAEQAEAIRLRASLAMEQSGLKTLLGLPLGSP